jgi:hypothetical protein
LDVSCALGCRKNAALTSPRHAWAFPGTLEEWLWSCGQHEALYPAIGNDGL